MAEELNINVTGFNLPPIEVKGTFTIPPIRIDGQNGKSAYEIWLEAGNSGTREDFLNSLKGQDGRNGNNGLPGKDASAQGSYEMLMGMNVYCENATPDEVLKGLIRGLGDAINKPFKQLDFDRPQKGQTYVNVYGTPHFKVALLSKGVSYGASLGDDGRARIDLDTPFGADDIQLEYFNMLGRTVGTYRITGYSDIKTTLAESDFPDKEITELNYPEVTTIEDNALNSLTQLATINLPKLKRIGDTYLTSYKLSSVNIPSYTVSPGDENKFVFNLFSIRMFDLMVSEQSDIDTLVTICNQSTAIIYNSDKSKKFDKNTKSWVPAQ